MATHNLEPERSSLHGKFSRDFPPVLTIDPGDTVIFRTLDASWGLEPFESFDVPRRLFEPRVEEQDSGHSLVGPVAIRGAEPGMALEVQINEVVPGAYGATYAAGWPSPINNRLGIASQPRTALRWTLDAATMTGRDQHGHSLDLHPFMGVMGLAPAEPGIHSTTPPRYCGGNIDCKELVAGTSLYLPVAVSGGLFSTGDGHGTQSDGESSGTAIECPMDRVSLTFRLHPDMKITTPRARIANAWLTMGFNEDLDEAAALALEAMLDLMEEQYSMPRMEALALTSLVVDLRVTQIVNQVKGVHAVLQDGSIK